MFYAARSGKQYLEIEWLENRRLMSADSAVAESSLPNIAHAPAVFAIPGSAVVASDSQSTDTLLGNFFSDNAVQLRQFFGTQTGEIELDELEVVTTQGVNIQFQDIDDSEDDVEIELHEPTAAAVSTSTIAGTVVAKPNHTMPISFATPVVKSIANQDGPVAPEKSTTNQPSRESLLNSKSIAENAIPIQQATASVAKESEPTRLASEYIPVPDALPESETNPASDSSSGNISVDNIPPVERPVASNFLQELSSDVIVNLAPSVRELFSAGLSGDYEAIDLAMNQLLSDLDTVRANATLIFDESILQGVACTAVVGAIAVAVARRRILEMERSVNRVAVEEDFALWMYPECSGISGGATL